MIPRWHYIEDPESKVIVNTLAVIQDISMFLSPSLSIIRMMMIDVFYGHFYGDAMLNGPSDLQM